MERLTAVLRRNFEDLRLLLTLQAPAPDNAHRSGLRGHKGPGRRKKDGARRSFEGLPLISCASLLTKGFSTALLTTQGRCFVLAVVGSAVGCLAASLPTLGWGAKCLAQPDRFHCLW